MAPPLPLKTFKRLLRADLDAIWAGRFRPSSGRRGPARGAKPPESSESSKSSQPFSSPLPDVSATGPHLVITPPACVQKRHDLADGGVANADEIV